MYGVRGAATCCAHKHLERGRPRHVTVPAPPSDRQSQGARPTLSCSQRKETVVEIDRRGRCLGRLRTERMPSAASRDTEIGSPHPQLQEYRDLRRGETRATLGPTRLRADDASQDCGGRQARLAAVRSLHSSRTLLLFVIQRRHNWIMPALSVSLVQAGRRLGGRTRGACRALAAFRGGPTSHVNAEFSSPLVLSAPPPAHESTPYRPQDAPRLRGTESP